MSIVSVLSTLVLCVVSSILISKWSSLVNLKKINTTGERFASQDKPIFGGIIFLIGLTTGVFVEYFTGVNSVESTLILLPIFFAFGAGLLDDVKNTPPGFKFITQIATGFLIYYLDLSPSFFDSAILDASLCVFWTVTLMNSLNMLDNMDAITSTVTLSVVAMMVVVAYAIGSLVNVDSSAMFLGIALMVFLVSNWHPSTMYMGDNGSQLIGAIVAILSLKAFGSFVQDSNVMVVLLSMVIALCVPLSDTASVSINRILAGNSPFVGDKNHTTHNLFYLGLSIPMVGIVFCVLTLLTNLVAYLLLLNYFENFIIDVLMVAGVGLVCLGLYYITTIKKENK